MPNKADEIAAIINAASKGVVSRRFTRTAVIDYHFSNLGCTLECYQGATLGHYAANP